MPQAERWRRAGDGDLDALTRLEREANLATLGHVFPPDRFPFPDDDVAARWALVLADPTAVVEVVGPDGGPLRALTAYDVGEGRASLRHLAVHPDAAGRGLGADGVERAVAAARAAGAAEVTLWCLAQNGRAQRLYARLGWARTGEARDSPWPPHPVEEAWALWLR
ncbi:GNAT family N-acetyltransferase [Nocardioides perillae]|uniref:Ribosomal protein S18 acetylase RimI-like enzyme n=1 Tax=Nocardioides perillae TaxID=1119534 RepID=A0A7Y9RY66_9ACTN|nr:ribosomal protein S18 acetylase RimI-like enzyme [Nocardioides perillae]